MSFNDKINEIIKDKSLKRFNLSFLLTSFVVVLFLSSCSTVEKISDKINILKPKETPDVAGKLVCAAAGIESEDCVEAVKTDEEVDETISSIAENEKNNIEANNQILESELLLK